MKEETRLYLLGPAALFCAAALSPLSLIVAIPGFILAGYFGMRGFAYALVLLGLGAFCNHGFLTPDHLWQFGLEVSLANSFWVTALAQEEKKQTRVAIDAKLEASVTTARNLEEELNRSLEEKTALQMAANARIGELQNKIEETEKDQSSLTVLNEVLRKTTARHIDEKNELERGTIDLQRKIDWMRQEIDRYEKGRPERDILMKELNAARVEKEQTHLINETLAKLHAQKCQEIEQLKVGAELEAPQGLSRFELMYQQLRKQFEEKSKVLHAARQELFYKETELEAVKIEKEQLALAVDPMILPLEQEIEELVGETGVLKEENNQLEQLIGELLTQQPKPAARKKKPRA